MFYWRNALAYVRPPTRRSKKTTPHRIKFILPDKLRGLGQRPKAARQRKSIASRASASAQRLNILPGFMMFCGSSAPLIAAMNSVVAPSSLIR